jgi:hypothetical protein
LVEGKVYQRLITEAIVVDHGWEETQEVEGFKRSLG